MQQKLGKQLPMLGWMLLLTIIGCCLGGCSALVSAPPWRKEKNLNVLNQLEAAVSQSRSQIEQMQPSHNRRWRPDLAVLPFATFDKANVTIHHIRDCRYRSEENYTVRHFDRTYTLNDLKSVDFIVVPFKDTPLLAHTMLSFGFANGEQLVISVEARLEQGEVYSPLQGSLKQYELMYIVGTEKDLIQLRTHVRDVDVYLYRGNATPEAVQDLFVDMIDRVNQIARKPEYYDTLTNNCTTNIVKHVNKLRPGSIPNDIRILLPGHSDQLAYRLGLIESNGPFEMVKRQSRINTLAKLFTDAADFSQKIRLR